MVADAVRGVVYGIYKKSNCCEVLECTYVGAAERECVKICKLAGREAQHAAHYVASEGAAAVVLDGIVGKSGAAK